MDAGEKTKCCACVITGSMVTFSEMLTFCCAGVWYKLNNAHSLRSRHFVAYARGTTRTSTLLRGDNYAYVLHYIIANEQNTGTIQYLGDDGIV